MNPILKGDIGSVPERELFVEKRQVLRLSCYKVTKFAPRPEMPLMEKIRARKNQDCPYGFTEIRPACQNCVWFKKDEIAMDGRPVTTDRVINKTDIPSMAVDYFTRDDEEIKKLK